MGTQTHWPEARPDAERAEIEARVGVAPIETLIAELEETEGEWSRLWAMHGPGGTWDDHRRALRAVLSEEKRDAHQAATGKRLSNEEAEDRAMADPRYRACVSDGESSRTRFAVLESRRASIMERIRRDNKITDFRAREASHGGA
jgi:hypothetical protein